jgi:hypothetical protein
VVSIDDDTDKIIELVGNFVTEAMNQNGYCTLQHQLKLYQTQFEETIYANADSLGSTYGYDLNPRMEYFKNDPVLGNLILKDMAGKDIN